MCKILVYTDMQPIVGYPLTVLYYNVMNTMTHSPIPGAIPLRVLARMLRYHVTSPYVLFWRTIEVAVMVELAARHGLDLQARVDVDVGCGNGVLGNALIRDIGIGFDMNTTGVAWARGHKPAYRSLLCASATAVPLHSDSQHVIFSNSVIEHIPDLDATLDEMARLVAPGGYIVLSTVSEQFPSLMLGQEQPPAQARHDLDRSYDHYHYLSSAKLRDALAKRGLQLLKSASYIDARQAHWCHQLRQWEQRQARAGIMRRLNQVRRAPTGLVMLSRMSPLIVPDGEGAGLAVIARRPV